MGHNIRKEKWEDIEHNLESSTEVLGNVQELIEELMEDYSYSNYAGERREKLAEMHADIVAGIESTGKCVC